MAGEAILMPTQNVSMSSETYDLVLTRQSERGGTFSGAMSNLVSPGRIHLDVCVAKSDGELKEALADG